MDHFDPLCKKQKSQFKTTEQTPKLYHKFRVKTCIRNAETLRYIRSNQEEVLDKYEDVTKSKLIREDILVQRNHLKETSFDGAISFEVENELFNKPMLKDRLNEAQESNISNICKKIVPTEKGFDNHTCNTGVR